MNRLKSETRIINIDNFYKSKPNIIFGNLLVISIVFQKFSFAFIPNGFCSCKRMGTPIWAATFIAAPLA